jgi:polyribonucleotide nucleotidyltransferase
MDIKVDGLAYEILEKALNQAKEGRSHILNEMMKTMSEPREDYKPHVPRIEVMMIPKDTIGAVIGPGGKIIQKIQEETDTVIVIEEVADQGRIEIAAPNKASIDLAVNQIKGIVAVPEVGEIYKGKVKSIVAFGAFIEIMPGKDGLLHISEIDYTRHETVDEVFKEGDEVEVKLIDVDSRTGKLKLSRKVLLPKPEGYVEPKRPSGDRRGGDRRNNDRRGNDRNRDRDRRNNN